jgi:hypothetical protein
MATTTGLAGAFLTVQDKSQNKNSFAKGICAVAGVTERGQLATPRLIKSWYEYQRYFGGLLVYDVFPLMCQRALNAGCQLLISRVAHYTDITDATTAVGGTASAVYTYSGWGITFSAKNIGSWGNSLTVDIAAAASGGSGVDITVKLAGYPQFGYSITDFPSAPSTQDIETFNSKSQLVNFDSSYGTILPAAGLAFTFGTDDYTSLDVTDYVGDAIAMTGFHAFDANTEFTRIAVLSPLADYAPLHDALIDYCESKNVMGFFPCPLLETGYNALDFRMRQGIYTGGAIPDSWKCRLFFGDVLIKNPSNSSATLPISVVSDALGAAAKKDATVGEWFSESGINRGVIGDNSGLFYNLGTPARKAEADAVVNVGVNVAISDSDNGVVLFSNATLLRTSSLLQEANIAELVLYIQRTLPGIVKGDLFEPNDPITWKNIYRKAAKFLTDLTTRRAIFGFEYFGDQDVDNVSQATVNDPVSIAAGNYNALINIFPETALEKINLGLTVSAAGVDVTVL